MAKQTIEHDLRLFFEHELVNIRTERFPSSEWPGERSIQTLVRMAVPLFIFAATVCRFVGGTSGNPRSRLQDILEYEIKDVNKLDMTYFPILDILFRVQNKREREKLSEEFQKIVGSIVVLESPLSIISIARLLDIPKDDIICRLDSLHSVLGIPDSEDVPVRLLHLSFREFLVDPQKKGKSPFWVDERETHQRLASQCLEVMSRPKGLQGNICKLPSPGVSRSKIDERQSLAPYPPSCNTLAVTGCVIWSRANKTSATGTQSIYSSKSICYIGWKLGALWEKYTRASI